MRRDSVRHVLRCGAAAGALLAMQAAPAWGQSAAAGDAKPAQAKAGASADQQPVQEVIVTGVLGPRAIENAPIAIQAVTNAQIQQQVPVSTADLLKNVPGVFVNSALGEIRNVVFSRGVSANSLDAAGGYFYVSLQEDGLPVEQATNTNFGPDYFARTDLMLDHLEALRGGTAALTGPNAPGGIFNYISRTGKSHPGTEIQARFGLEGDGRFPYYRADAYTGGKLGEDLYYAVGGFYRRSEGARYPGYPLNKGGQIRGNLRWDYTGGKVTVTAKYLNDHNGWFEFLPAFNYQDPQIAPGFNNESSVLPPATKYSYASPFGGTRTYDDRRMAHARSLAFGVNWDQDLGDKIHLENRARYSRNRSDWNTGAVIFAIPLDDIFAGILTGTFGIPGVTTYRDHNTHAIVAQVNSFSGFDRTVTLNNLPNQNLLANGVLTQAAYSQNYRAHEFDDQATLSAELGNHHLAIGGFLSLNKLSNQSDAAGLGVSYLQPQPQLLDMEITSGGVTYAATNPQGIAAIGRGFGGDGYHGTQNQYAAFFGDTWNPTDKLNVEVGVRYENIRYDITNLTSVSFAGNPLTTPGADGNVLTLYDNGLNTFGTPTRTKRDFHFFNYTGSVAYQFTSHFQTYLRYTRGKKAPDFGIVQAIDTPDEIANLFPKPQQIEQIELGLKYRAHGLSLAAFPFYSRLSNVADGQIFQYRSGPSIGQSYSPPSVFGTIKTYGVEVSADWDLTRQLHLNAAVTLQNPKASGFSLWIQGVKGDGTDDTLQTIAPGLADNNPKVIVRSTATYSPTETLSFFATVNYLGKRAANRRNAFFLPAFTTVDAGGSITLFEKLKLQANVTNVFNTQGIMSWASSGGFLSSLDRQSLTREAVASNPNQLFSIIPSQPRAFWLTGTFSF